MRSLASTGIDLLEFGLDDRARQAMKTFDSIMSWYGSARAAFRDALSGLPVEFFPALPDGSCHAVEFYMRQVGGSDASIPHFDIGSVPRRNFIAIHPFSGSPRKNWSLPKFRELQRALPLPAEFSAGPEEELEGAVRFDTILELAAWLASARLYIGNDSGVSHLAAAVGTPSIVIFRSTDPKVWCPRSRSPVLPVTCGDEDGPEVSVVARHAERLVEFDDNGRP
ncbi:MAG TPA: glycosyltransferase family 9 protein [Bryobacteraceae bacterium]|nr:glycosyltransferase family 9 protein [Bryobacteraceae bacterium]